MTHPTTDQAIHLALEHHQAGRFAEAEAYYRRILEYSPAHPDALHLLGVLAGQVGRTETAIQLIGRAIAVNPLIAEFHGNLAEIYRRTGRIVEAMASYRRVTELKPDSADGWNSLGSALRHQGRFDEAIAAYNRALRIRPELAEAHNNLGNALSDSGRLDEALAAFKHAIALRPDLADAHNNLGGVLRQQGRSAEAIASYCRAIALRPDYAEAHNNLGGALTEARRFDEAIAPLARAISLRPDLPQAHDNLGTTLKETRRFTEAIAAHRRAIALSPDYAEAYNNLGNALNSSGQYEEALGPLGHALVLRPDLAAAHSNLGRALFALGRLDEAIACLRRALALKPDLEETASTLAYSLQFHPDYDASAILAEHRRWEAQFAAPLERLIRPHTNLPMPGRRLRIGYVSPDFRDHVVGRNLAPLFRHHDHRQFEIFCYSNVIDSDRLTRFFQGGSDVWRHVAARTDSDLADLIREDSIDILVDLTLHMVRNRLLVFARRPSPVQVTFAGYPGTTGLSAMDYRLTDPYLDPPGRHDAEYAEESVRLPNSFWCYDPTGDEPAVNAAPARANGFVTFGCFNHGTKLNPCVLALWARVLGAVEGSRLLLMSPSGSQRRDILGRLGSLGISPDRVTFVGQQPRQQYLELYHRVDLVLDTIPYNGHTTSLDALWMGVPVISAVGRTVVGRAGMSQLTNLGLPQLVGGTPDEFVRIAVTLAADLPRLECLRSTMRNRMRRSPLLDAPGFARDIEAAYRSLWGRWCAAHPELERSRGEV
jgi:protein O-GlcNAc transferase